MSSEEITVKVDSKGRIRIPKKLMDELQISEGSVVSLFAVKEKGFLLVEPVVSTFDVLAKEAKEEHKAGKTTTLEEYAKKNNIDLDMYASDVLAEYLSILT